MKSKTSAILCVTACLTACGSPPPPLASHDLSAATLFRDRLPVQSLPLSPSKLASFKAAVADEMKDPQSVQFRKLKGVKDAKGNEGLCGEINAKNSYGGYIGFKPFYALIGNGKTGVATPDEPFGDIVRLMCGV